MVARTPPKQTKMVARTPPKQTRMVAPLNPVLLRETVKKVDRCMARLQELQYTVTGGTKVISGVSLSPRSTRGYLRASLRCKQESVRIKNAASKISPGKFPTPQSAGEWRRMSLPAMLVGETVGEILQASQFAREIAAAVANKTTRDDPKTPVTHRRNQKQQPENTELRSRRKREKQNKLQLIRSESDSPSLQRARSRINFKVSSPPKVRDLGKENNGYLANRVSPKNRPWVKKTVLFPNPLFLSTASAKQQNFCKTGSPVMGRNKETPHKFLIKSPSSASSKFKVKIKSPPVVGSLSPTRPKSFTQKSPKMSAASKFRRSFSPSRLATRLASPLRSTKGVRSFSPSRMATKLASPLRSRKGSAQKSDGLLSGLRQRPTLTTMRL